MGKIYSPIARIMMAFEFEIAFIVFSTPILSLLVWKNSDVTGAASMIICLASIPLSILYNLFFDKLLREKIKRYKKHMKMRFINAFLYEAIITPFTIPILKHMLNISIEKATLTAILIGTIVGLCNMLFKYKFDSLESSHN